MVMVGDKVIAILDSNAETKTVRVFGEGVYAGDCQLPDTMQLPGMKNARIDLDGGGHVWGFECWWAEPARLQLRFPKPAWTWVEVSVDEYRKNRSM